MPDPWVHISFRINSYSVNEWPPQELNDLESFCIGEEQSSSTVVALSWSPVGLAKHKRSVLAVLATNHVLSLWASVSDLKTASTWERVLLVNKAFGTPDQRHAPRDEGALTCSGIPRRSARVQSMSWAPTKPDDSAYYKDDLQRATSKIGSPTQYLAVTNDADEVVILLIQSGWMHHSKSLWEAQIVSRVTWQDLRSLFSSPQISYTEEDLHGTVAASKIEWPSMFARPFNKKAFIDRVVCTPCQNYQAGLGLRLRRGREILQLDISYKSISRRSTVDSWLPVSCSRQASSCYNSFSYFDCGDAIFLPKVFSPFPRLEH